ncbi:hypothetical protein MMC12_008257 [Toensbergia leucococca]|nr:hypothetical protein [Toensbergia leucococca]
MKADGNDRRSPNFRGTIQTAILYTCRQINKEARHIPLTINQLSFVSPLHALSFLGFSLAPTQKDLVTSMHIEIRVTDIYSIPLMMLLNEVAKMPITEFGVTLMGAVSREWFQGHTCFTSRFEILKNLKKFNLVIGSGIIKPKMKEEIAAHISKILVKGKTATPFGSKRKADKDSDAIKSIKPVKIAKTLPPAASSATQARSVLPKGRNGRIVYKPTRPALRTMRKDNEESKGPLLERYGQLEEYARSFDYAASSVRIRLEGARQAAEEGNQAIFEDLESGIMQTLEDHFVKIWRSRRKIPDSMKLPVF